MAGRKKKRKRRKWLKLNRRTHVKLLLLFSGIIVAFGGLMVRLMYIEHTSGEKYQKIVLAQQGYDSVTIPYRRGDILDSRGTVLATSTDVYNIILDCSVLTSREQYLEPTVRALMKVFPDEIDESELRAYIKENPASRYKVLAKRVSYERVQEFEELKKTKKESDTDTDTESDKDAEDSDVNQKDEKDDNSTKDKTKDAKDDKEDSQKKDSEKVDESRYIKGVWFEKEYTRMYPYKKLASAVIGFTTSGNVGMAGLENYYDDILNGTNGRQYGYLNSENSVEKTIKDATDGNNIVTTIDMNIQSVVERKISDFNKAYTNAWLEGDGAEHIGVVIEDPNTGDILAMANYPNYDLTNPRSLEEYYTKDEIDGMSDEDKTDALNTLWQNFCISYTYEPGSTQKPLTVAAGFDTGRLTGNEVYDCKGFERVGDRDIYCVNTSGHGAETVKGALMDSCNVALMKMVEKIGKENFCHYLNIFGMGLRTNIDLPGEARTDSLVRPAEDTGVVDLATESFGQNFNCTMIQMISAFSSVINGGNYYQPHIVSKITDQNGNTVEEIEPKLLKQTVSKETSDRVKEYLYATVSKGTAKTAKVPGYSMGGKTGTAEKLPRKNGKYLVSYIGYVPQEHPQLVIYVVVDTPNQNTKDGSQAHSTFAQNIAREILEEILPYMNIYKDEKIEKDALLKKDTNMYTAIAGYESRAALGEAVSYD